MNLDFAFEDSCIHELSFRLNSLKETLKREEKELTKADKTLQRTQDAQEIIQHLAQAVQQRAHKKLSDVVSSCLSSVFGEEAYQFKIEFDRKRGRTEAHLRFVRGDLDVDPMTASGGGVVDVAAFALRIACLVLHRPRLSRVVVLDEPFKFLSVEYRPQVREMLEQISKEMGLQIILVTHIDELATGKVIEL